MNPVTKIHSPRLNEYLGCRVVLASECFQITGSFKYRAALNVVRKNNHSLFITASSGNFGQALAAACERLNKSCIVAMPHDSAKVKIDGVQQQGGQVELIDVQTISRAEKVAALMEQHPEAYQASAYDDPLVIEGNASLGKEIAAFTEPLDAVLAPIGGGGLTSGLAQGLRQSGKITPLWAVEPELANDAAQSLKAGKLVELPQEPKTIADGVRSTCVGQHNWTILKNELSGILEVTEESIRKAVNLLFHLANLKVEPTGALSLAALLVHPNQFKGQTVCCVISGGNVDPNLYRELIAP